MTVFGLACSEFFCFNFLFWYFLTPDDLLENFLVLHNFFQIKNVIAQFPWFCNYSILFHLQNFENFLFPKCLKQKSSWNISDWFLNLCHYLFFCKITAKQFYNIWPKGREPWFSGYGKRLISKGCEFKSRHSILDGHFSHTYLL